MMLMMKLIGSIPFILQFPCILAVAMEPQSSSSNVYGGGQDRQCLGDNTELWSEHVISVE